MVFYKYHGCGNDFVLIDEIKNADYRSLADRLCLADGNFENIVCVDHTVYDPFVIGDEHGVGVVIATVEPLLDIVLNGVHADDIRREIEVPHKVVAMRVPREVIMVS